MLEINILTVVTTWQYWNNSEIFQASIKWQLRGQHIFFRDSMMLYDAVTYFGQDVPTGISLIVFVYCVLWVALIWLFLRFVFPYETSSAVAETLLPAPRTHCKLGRYSSCEFALPKTAPSIYLAPIWQQFCSGNWTTNIVLFKALHDAAKSTKMYIYRSSLAARTAVL